MKHDQHIVSVIIPTIGRSTINVCKEALSRQTRPPDEVLVVADHEWRGVSWARNDGITQARGDLIAFIDDDCIPPEDWVERLIRAIDKYDAAGVGGTYQETDPLLHDIRLRRKIPETEQVDAIGLVGIGGNVMYKRTWLDVLAEHDGYVFSESYTSFGSEDHELALRLRLLGAKLVFVPNKVTHLRRVTAIKFLSHQFNRGIGIGLLFNFHRSLKNELLTTSKSLIWGGPNAKSWARWSNVFWYKVIGPFDMRSFRLRRNFWLFWIGEKIQGIGFLWCIFINSIRGEKGKGV
jgi:glycosyltransferase involved in cell wall biosynthesis